MEINFTVTCDDCGAELKAQESTPEVGYEETVFIRLGVERCTCYDQEIKETGYEEGFAEGQENGSV